MTCAFFVRRLFHPIGAVALAAAVSGCNLENQVIPSPTGPSEFGVAITTAALPDQLRRDGASQSTVSITARGTSGQPLGSQRIALSFVSPSASGAMLSATEVTTAPDGSAVFTVTAPPNTVPGDRLTVALTPVGSNFDNSAQRTFTIALTPSNPSAPVASFTFTPAAPALNETVSFDASGSTDEGIACLDACSYSWDFGDGRTGSGRIVAHAFTSSGNRSVTLTVRDSAGAASVPSTRTVTISAPEVPVAVLVVSPTGNRPAGSEINFDGAGSTVGIGASIVEYAWVWGDGSSNTTTSTPQTRHSFGAAGTYVVRLTIRDSLGRTATTTASVTIIVT